MGGTYRSGLHGRDWWPWAGSRNNFGIICETYGGYFFEPKQGLGGGAMTTAMASIAGRMGTF